MQAFLSSALRSSLGAAVVTMVCAAAGCGDGGTTGAGGSGGTGGTATATAQGGSGGAGGSTGGANTGGGGTGGSNTGGGDSGPVPDPGMVMGGEWTDVEPNDAPSKAVPVGILNGPVWMGFAEPYTAISSPTDVDYFVFKSADAASLVNVNIQICWSFAGNLLDLNLYDVVDNQKGALVKSAATTNTSCETLIDFGQGADVLQPDSIYLLEVVAGPGLDLAGDPGLYSA